MTEEEMNLAVADSYAVGRAYGIKPDVADTIIRRILTERHEGAARPHRPLGVQP
jgi:hypothetical protein